MTSIDQETSLSKRVGGWLANRHLSTWLLIVALITIALIVRPQVINFVIFIFVAAFLFLIRNLGRLEGASGAPLQSRRSTVIALVVMGGILIIAIFGVRYIAI